MLLHASKVFLTMCLLYVGLGLAMNQKAENMKQLQQLSLSRASGSGSYNPIIVTCKDGSYTRQTIMEALKRGFEKLQYYLSTGIVSDDLMEYSFDISGVYAIDKPFYATSVIYPNENRRKAMIVFNKFGSLVSVVTQTKIVHVREGPRVEYLYESCAMVKDEGL